MIEVVGMERRQLSWQRGAPLAALHAIGEFGESAAAVFEGFSRSYGHFVRSNAGHHLPAKI